jgi:hypothetical protein
VCSFRTASVRRNIRELLDEPGVKESLLSAMANVDTKRLLVQAPRPELVTIN